VQVLGFARAFASKCWEAIDRARALEIALGALKRVGVRDGSFSVCDPDC
jgi:hypothetical protein